MKKLNKFQLKSLSNFCFDLAKAWFVAGVIAPIGAPSIPLLNKTFLVPIGIAACWLSIKFGLSLGEDVKNE